MSDQEKFILRVLELCYRYDSRELLGWSVKDGAVSFYVNCNDLFFWGCADSEEITQESVDVLEKALADCKAVNMVTGTIEAGSLYAARIRNMRPQGACYECIEKEFWPLYDECGPEREVGPGNPIKHPSK